MPLIDAGLDSTSRIQRENICADDVVAFLRSLSRNIEGYCSSWIDGVSIKQKYWGNTWNPPKTIRVEWLPAYAPDLNPVEQVWNHSKYTDLVNLAPEDSEQVAWSMPLSAIPKGKDIFFRSFFQRAGLAL
jgi:transposase